MRARIPPALLAMAAVSAVAGGAGSTAPAATEPETPQPRRERKRQKSEKEPRSRRHGSYPYGRMNDPVREQAAIDKRARKNQRRFWNAVATTEGQVQAARELSDRERRRRSQR